VNYNFSVLFSSRYFRATEASPAPDSTRSTAQIHHATAPVHSRSMVHVLPLYSTFHNTNNFKAALQKMHVPRGLLNH